MTKFLLCVNLFIFCFTLSCTKNKQQAYYFLAKEYQTAMGHSQEVDKQLEKKFLLYIHKAMESNPDNFYLNESYADFWYLKKDWKQAEKYYQRALQAKKDVPQVYYRLAQIYLQQDKSIFNPKQAFYNAKKALHYAGESLMALSKDETAQILIILAQTYLLQQQYQEAFETLMQAFNEVEDRVLKGKIETMIPDYVKMLEAKK